MMNFWLVLWLVLALQVAASVRALKPCKEGAESLLLGNPQKTPPPPMPPPLLRALSGALSESPCISTHVSTREGIKTPDTSSNLEQLPHTTAEQEKLVLRDSPRVSEATLKNPSSLKAQDHSRQDIEELSNVGKQNDSLLQLSNFAKSTKIFTTTRNNEEAEVREFETGMNSEREHGDPAVMMPELLRGASHKAIDAETLSENSRVSGRLVKLTSQAASTKFLNGKIIQENDASNPTQNKISAPHQQSSESEFSSSTGRSSDDKLRDSVLAITERDSYSKEVKVKMADGSTGIPVLRDIKMSSPSEKFELINSNTDKVETSIVETGLRNGVEMAEQQTHQHETFTTRPTITGLSKLVTESAPTQQISLSEDSKRKDNYSDYLIAKLATILRNMSTRTVPSENEYEYIFTDIFIPKDHLSEESNVNTEPQTSLITIDPPVEGYTLEDSRKLSQETPKLENQSTTSMSDKVSKFVLLENKTLAQILHSLFDINELNPYDLISGTHPFKYSQSHIKGNGEQMVYPYRPLKVKPKGIALDVFLNDAILEQNQDQVSVPEHPAGRHEMGNVMSGRNIPKNTLPVVKYLQEPEHAVRFSLPVIERETRIISSSKSADSMVYPTLRKTYGDETPRLQGIHPAIRSEGEYVSEHPRPYRKNSNANFPLTFQGELIITPESQRERESDELESHFYRTIYAYNTSHASPKEDEDVSAELPSAIQALKSEAEVESGEDMEEIWKEPGWVIPLIRKFPGHKRKSELQIPPTELDMRDTTQPSRNHVTAEHLWREYLSHARRNKLEPKYIGGNLIRISTKDVINEIADDSKAELTLPNNGTIAVNANQTERKLKTVSEHSSDVSKVVPQILPTHINTEIAQSNTNIIKPNLKFREELGTQVHKLQDPAGNIGTPQLQSTEPKFIFEDVHLFPQSKERKVSYQLRSKEPNWGLKSFSDFPENVDIERNSEIGTPLLQIFTCPDDTASLSLKFQQEEHVIPLEPKLSSVELGLLPSHSDLYDDTNIGESHGTGEFPTVKQTELLSSESSVYTAQSLNREYNTIPTKVNDVRLTKNEKSDVKKHPSQTEKFEWRAALTTPSPEEWPSVSQKPQVSGRPDWEKPVDDLQISTKLPREVTTHLAQTGLPTLEIHNFERGNIGDTTETPAESERRRLMYGYSGSNLVKLQQDLKTKPATSDTNTPSITESASEKQLELFRTETSTNPAVHLEHRESSSAEHALQIKSKLFTTPNPLRPNSIKEKHLELLPAKPSTESTGNKEKNKIVSAEIRQELEVKPTRTMTSKPVASKSVTENQNHFFSAETSKPTKAATDEKYSKSIPPEVHQELKTIPKLNEENKLVPLDYITEKQLHLLSMERSTKPEVHTEYITNIPDVIQQESEIKILRTEPPKTDSSKESRMELLSSASSTKTTLNADYIKNFSAEIEAELGSKSVVTETSKLVPSKQRELLSTERITKSAVGADDAAIVSAESEKDLKMKGTLTETPVVDPTKSITAEQLTLISTSDKQKALLSTESGTVPTLDAKSQQQLEIGPILTETPIPAPHNVTTEKLFESSSKFSVNVDYSENMSAKIKKETGVEKRVGNIPNRVPTKSSAVELPELLSNFSDTKPAVDAGYVKNILADMKKEQENKPLLTGTTKSVLPTATGQNQVQDLSTEPSSNPAADIQHMKNFSSKIDPKLKIEPIRNETPKPVPQNITAEIVFEFMLNETSDNPSANAEYLKNLTAGVGTGPILAHVPNLVTPELSSQGLHEFVSDMSMNKHEFEAEELTFYNKSKILSTKFNNESKLDAENVMEHDKGILFRQLNTPPVQQFSSNPEKHGYNLSSVTSPSASSPKQQLAAMKSRVLEVKHSQTTGSEQEALQPAARSSYPLRGNEGASTHESDIEKEIRLPSTEATSYSLHINGEEHDISSNTDHSGEVYSDKETGLFSQGVRRSSETLEYVASGEKNSESYRPETTRENRVSQWYIEPSIQYPIASITDRAPHTPSSNKFYSDFHKQEPQVVPSESKHYSSLFAEMSATKQTDESQAVAEPLSGLQYPLTQPDKFTRDYTLTEAVPLSPEFSSLRTDSPLHFKEYIQGDAVSLLESNGGTLHTVQPLFSDTVKTAVGSKFSTSESNSYIINPKQLQIQQALESDSSYKLGLPEKTYSPTRKSYISHPQELNWKPSTAIDYPKGLMSNFKPHLSKVEIEGPLPFLQESKINVPQERDDHIKSKFVEKSESLKRDNHRVNEYETESEKLHSSYLEPNVLEEVVKLNTKNIPHVGEPDAAFEIKEKQVQDYHIISSLLHHEDPSYNIIKRPLSVQSDMHPTELTDALLRELQFNQRPLQIPEFSEMSSPQKLVKIASSDGSEGDILENNLQSRKLVSNPLSDKALRFFTRFGKPSLSEALDEFSSSKNTDRIKVLQAQEDEREISGFHVDNSENSKTTESTSLDNKLHKFQTSETWVNKHANDTSDNPGENILKKLVKFGTSKIHGLVEGLGSLFGLNSIKIAGEISGPGKSLVRESPEEWTLKGSGDHEFSRGKNVPLREKSPKRAETGEEKSSYYDKYAVQLPFL